MVTKTILITGASRGIGRATALKAAALGWNVAINYVHDAAAAKAAAGLVEQSGVRAMTVQADVASAGDVERMFAQTAETLGALDGVVINAGIIAPASRLADMTIDRLRRMVDVNVMGTLVTARGAARALSGKSGSIVIVSSAASRLGSADEYVDYAACKGAADSLTIGLARELGPQDIRVNAVRPAFIETQIHASGGRPDRAGVLGAATPMGRSGQAEEVAEAITWLISDASSYVTGTFVDMSGGR